METWYVYIAKCVDGSFYVGCTNDLQSRMERHNKGYVDSTKYRKPLKVLTHITFTDKYLALNFEKYLKTGSGRAFMFKRLIDIKSGVQRS